MYLKLARKLGRKEGPEHTHNCTHQGPHAQIILNEILTDHRKCTNHTAAASTTPKNAHNHVTMPFYHTVHTAVHFTACV